jgi:hypothetical protein
VDAWWLEPQGEPGPLVAAGGDVGLVGALRAAARAGGYQRVLEAPARALRAADVGTVNLEFPVVDGVAGTEFWHERAVLPALRGAGVHVVSLANNHMMDLGERGLLGTLEACAEAGLQTVGAGRNLEAARRPLVERVGGATLGWLAYATPHRGDATARRAGVAPFEAAAVRADLRALRPRVDWLVVHVHWGSMYVDYPPPRVMGWAALLAEEGADLVVGHHPHVLQGAGRLGRGLVLYSLGDLAFDPSVGEFYAEVGRAKRRLGAVATVRLARGASGLQWMALAQGEGFLPRPAGEAEARAVDARLRELSAGLGQAAAHFAAESGPDLVRYGLQGLGHYLRHGQLHKVLRVVGALRPRHVSLLWRYLRRRQPRQA